MPEIHTETDSYGNTIESALVYVTGDEYTVHKTDEDEPRFLVLRHEGWDEYLVATFVRYWPAVETADFLSSKLPR